MRTTVEFDDDTGAAVERVRREEGVGVSEAVNRLIRQSLLTRGEPRVFHQHTSRLGLRIDVSNIGDALDALEDRTAP
jgi:hypothetical protein